MHGSLRILLLMIGLALPARASASCVLPTGASSSLAVHDPAARLHFIRQTLRDTVRQENFYLGAWSVIYGGIAAGTWLFVPLSDDVPGQTRESAWNTATALGAAVVMMIEPLRVGYEQRQLERLVAQQTDGCAVLKEAERLFARVAESETSARGALMHVGNFAINIGIGLVLAYGLNRPDSAPMNTVVGTLLGELMIVTRPTLASRRLASYRSGDLSLSRTGLIPFLSAAPTLLPGGYGFAISGAF